MALLLINLDYDCFCFLAAGSTLEAMAHAVEKASVVIVCLTHKYKESPSCRTGNFQCSLQITVNFKTLWTNLHASISITSHHIVMEHHILACLVEVVNFFFEDPISM